MIIDDDDEDMVIDDDDDEDMIIDDDDNDNDQSSTWWFPVERTKLDPHWHNLRSCREAAYRIINILTSIKVTIFVYQLSFTYHDLNRC